MDVNSFDIDHDVLLRGIYVSRADILGNEICTTYDIRIKEPNREPVIDNCALHTLEHLLAIYLRSDANVLKEDVIYIGPMGCRTGMYLILKDKRDSSEIVDLVKNAFKCVMDWNDAIPAAQSKTCGNYLEHNLKMAQYEARKFYDEVLSKIRKENLIYPK